MLIIVFTFVCAIALIIGISLAVNKPFTKQIQRTYALYFFFFTCWSIFTFISLNTSQDSLHILVLRALFLFGILQTYFYTKFIDQYSLGLNNTKTINYKFYNMIFLAATLASISPIIITGLRDNGSGTMFPVFGVGIVPTIAFVLTSLIYSAILVRRISEGTNKNSSWILLAILGIIMYLTPITNAVLTNIYETTIFIELSILYLATGSLIVGLNIFTDSLFKLTVITIRAITYFLLTGLFILIIYGVVYLLSSRLVDGSHTLPVVMISMSFGLGLAVIPALRQIRNLTDRIFFMKTYSTLDILNSLSDEFIKYDELGSLLRSTVSQYQSSIRPMFIEATAVHGGCVISRITSKGNLGRLGDYIYLVNHSWRVKKTEDLPPSKFKNFCEQNDIKLISTTSRSSELNGVFLFGPKQTGTPYTKQDIDLLLVSGKNLAIAIENAIRFKKIEDFNEELKNEIMIATKKLKATNKKLVALDKSKDEFISMASHQLRTPLTAIKNLSLVNLNGTLGGNNNKQKEALNLTAQSSERMVLLIEELLNVSRINSGKLSISKSRASLNDLVDSVIDQAKVLADAKNIKIIKDCVECEVIADFDEVKLKEVLLNFMDNSIQYSEPKSNIVVSLDSSSGLAKIQVIDRGMGIPKDEQPKLFSKFFRARNARYSRPDGTGLGLFVAKEVIQKHGGEIIFKSKEGKGSTFGFQIPVPS